MTMKEEVADTHASRPSITAPKAFEAWITAASLTSDAHLVFMIERVEDEEKSWVLQCS